MSYAVESVFKTKMILDKVCSIQLHYSQEVCQNLDSGDYDVQQNTVQKITNKYNLYCMLIEMIPALFIMIFLGTLSDTRSRRLPLMLPMLGGSLKALGLFMNAYWWSLKPFYILLSYFPFGLMGGFMAPFAAAYAYLGENSGAKWRTTRLSVVGGVMVISVSVGHGLGSILFTQWGYFGVFACEFLMTATAFVYVSIRLSNDHRPKSVARGNGTAEKCSMLQSVKQSVMVVLRKREGGVRAQMLGHIVCIALVAAVFGGTQNLKYLYTRKKFEWTYNQYTVWTVCGSPFSLFGSYVLLPILNYCQVPDEIIGFIGAASEVFHWTIIGTAPAPWFLYLGIAMTTGTVMTITSSRGVLSKLVATDELGAVFSVVGLFESLMPVISVSLFTAIYNNTLDFFSGTAFIVGGLIALFICFMYTWLSGYSIPPSRRMTA